MLSEKNKSRILVISHVMPFPKTSGQGMRVLYSLLALKQFFNVTFLATQTYLEKAGESQLREICDELIIMPPVYKRNYINRLVIKFLGTFYSFITGLRFTNFVINYFEYSPKRIRRAIGSRNFNLVLYEYWHAYRSVSVFEETGIPCVLDMHNILLQGYISNYDRPVPAFVKRIHTRKYQKAEEDAWKRFDALISINKNEFDYLKNTLPASIKLFYIAMGIDLAIWPYAWQPQNPPRLAYYGGMSSLHNMQNAMFCAKSIMPLIWQKYPEAEFWIIGSKPGEELLSLAKDSRIHVTGYLKSVQEVLKHISIFLCPWNGKYGFRSRIIEVMAIGVPVICSVDAVDGMELVENKGISFANNGSDFAGTALQLLDNPELLANQSVEARRQVEKMYSFENTYQSGVEEIKVWLLNR